jgi:hypothetical protein
MKYLWIALLGGVSFLSAALPAHAASNRPAGYRGSSFSSGTVAGSAAPCRGWGNGGWYGGRWYGGGYGTYYGYGWYPGSWYGGAWYPAGWYPNGWYGGGWYGGWYGDRR